MNKMLGDQGPQTMDEVGYLVSVVIITWNLLTEAMRHPLNKLGEWTKPSAYFKEMFGIIRENYVFNIS